MKKLLTIKIVKYTLSSVLYGLIYSLVTFVFDGCVEVDTVLVTTVYYFLFTCLLYYIAPKIRKITGHDKDNNQ